jgi:hypothetical protein
MQLELFRDGQHVELELELGKEPTAIDPPTLLAELIAENIVPLTRIDKGDSKPN